MALTKLENLVDPIVMADAISAQLPNAIRFTPLAIVNRDLEGVAGSTLQFPAFVYIGDATTVPEGTPIPIETLTAGTKGVTVAKAGIGVELTDEAVLSGHGDPLAEAQRQLTASISNKIDNDFVTVLEQATQTLPVAGPMTVASLQEALDIFNDEDEGRYALVISPAHASELRADAGIGFLSGTELGADAFIRGTYGDVLGAQVVRSRKVDTEAYLIKEGALALVMKRDVMVESDRDIINKTTVITADAHYAVYLYDPTKVVKITFTAG